MKNGDVCRALQSDRGCNGVTLPDGHVSHICPHVCARLDCMHTPALLHVTVATVILSNLNLAVRQQEASMLTDASAVVHPQQLFQELRQHSRLLSRPRFLTALQNEQLTLAKHVSLGGCHSLLQQCQHSGFVASVPNLNPHPVLATCSPIHC